MSKGGKIRDFGDVCRECGKVIFRRRRTARRQVKLIERQHGHSVRRRARHGPLGVYECPSGNGYHVGHRKDTDLPPMSEIVRIGEAEQ